MLQHEAEYIDARPLTTDSSNLLATHGRTIHLGQKRTSRYLHLMSALPPKVDIGTQLHDVRFVPKADICSAAIYDLLEQVLTYFCQQVARAVRLRHVVITSRCSRYMFFPIQRM